MRYSKQELEPYRGVDSVFIAAALTRIFGWELRAQVVDLHDGDVRVVKAWAVRSEPVSYIDIAGVHKTEPVTTDVAQSRVLTAMTEKDLYSILASGRLNAQSKAQWDAQVLKALDVVKFDLLMRLSHA